MPPFLLLLTVASQTVPLAQVPFTLHQNAVIVPVLVNGRDTVHLLLDTGWGPVALINLYKALGGGWVDVAERLAPPPATSGETASR